MYPLASTDCVLPIILLHIHPPQQVSGCRARQDVGQECDGAYDDRSMDHSLSKTKTIHPTSTLHPHAQQPQQEGANTLTVNPTFTTTTTAADDDDKEAEEREDRNRSESELARRHSTVAVVDDIGVIDSSAQDKGEGERVAASAAGEHEKAAGGFKAKLTSFFRRHRTRGPAVAGGAGRTDGSQTGATLTNIFRRRRGPSDKELENSNGPAVIRMDSSYPAVGSGGGPTDGRANAVDDVPSAEAAMTKEEAPPKRRFSVPRLPSWRKGAVKQWQKM